MGMFSGFMAGTWEAASIVAVVAGVVGFFVVLRGAAFVADAVPQGAFTGAAAASLLGINTLIGVAGGPAGRPPRRTRRGPPRPPPNRPE
ncbi:MAG: metal ABC transporter permease [Streptosporangiales bacterium]